MGYNLNEARQFLAEAEQALILNAAQQWVDTPTYKDYPKQYPEDNKWVAMIESDRLNPLLQKMSVGSNKWEGFKDILKGCHKKIEKQKDDEFFNTVMANHIHYCRALSNAMVYLEKKANSGTPMTESREKFIDEQFEFLREELKKYIPAKHFEKEISTEQPKELTPEESKHAEKKAERKEVIDVFKNVINDVKNEAQDAVKAIVVDEEVKSLLKSPEFQSIEAYAKFLEKDDRSHKKFRFFGEDLTVNKAETLQTFITDLKKSTNVDELKTKLDDFQKGDKNPQSTYGILNTGQNLFTRTFGVRTTTIEKIDAFSELVNHQPDKKNVM